MTVTVMGGREDEGEPILQPRLRALALNSAFPAITPYPYLCRLQMLTTCTLIMVCAPLVNCYVFQSSYLASQSKVTNATTKVRTKHRSEAAKDLYGWTFRSINTTQRFNTSKGEWRLGRFLTPLKHHHCRTAFSRNPVSGHLFTAPAFAHFRLKSTRPYSAVRNKDIPFLGSERTFDRVQRLSHSEPEPYSNIILSGELDRERSQCLYERAPIQVPHTSLRSSSETEA